MLNDSNERLGGSGDSWIECYPVSSSCGLVIGSLRSLCFGGRRYEGDWGSQSMMRKW